MVEGASPELLRELLIEFERAVTRAGLPPGAFRPGLSSTEVVDRLGALGVDPDPELVEWFTWHDGSSDGVSPLPLFPFAPLSYVEDRYEWGDLGAEIWQWAPGWIPVSAPGPGMAVGPSINGHPRVRPVTPEVTLQGDNHELQVVSLCTPVSWWIDAIHEGAYSWNGTYWERSLADPKDWPYFWLA
jgi:hypothetical protein